jgi:hypothetical protein
MRVFTESERIFTMFFKYFRCFHPWEQLDTISTRSLSTPTMFWNHFRQTFRCFPKQSIPSQDIHTQRVLNLYLRRHQDLLLGFGYHNFMRLGRGVVVLTLQSREGYRGKDLTFRREYFPNTHLPLPVSPLLSESLLNYDPQTEVVVSIQIPSKGIIEVKTLSQRGLSLALLHRQYLNQLLDQVVTPEMA